MVQKSYSSGMWSLLEFIFHIPWEGLEYNAGVNSVITAIFEQCESDRLQA